MRGQVACIEEIGNEYKILVRKPEGKRSLGRPRHRQDRVGLKEM
jgi:hypothetical protein